MLSIRASFVTKTGIEFACLASDCQDYVVFFYSLSHLVSTMAVIEGWNIFGKRFPSVKKDHNLNSHWPDRSKFHVYFCIDSRHYTSDILVKFRL